MWVGSVIDESGDILPLASVRWEKDCVTWCHLIGAIIAGHGPSLIWSPPCSVSLTGGRLSGVGRNLSRLWKAKHYWWKERNQRGGKGQGILVNKWETRRNERTKGKLGLKKLVWWQEIKQVGMKQRAATNKERETGQSDIVMYAILQYSAHTHIHIYRIYIYTVVNIWKL